MMRLLFTETFLKKLYESLKFLKFFETKINLFYVHKTFQDASIEISIG